MEYANAVKLLCKTENFVVPALFRKKHRENSQIKQHRSAKAAKF